MSKTKTYEGKLVRLKQFLQWRKKMWNLGRSFPGNLTNLTDFSHKEIHKKWWEIEPSSEKFTFLSSPGPVALEFHGHARLGYEYCKSGNFRATFIFALFTLQSGCANIKARDYVHFVLRSM